MVCHNRRGFKTTFSPFEKSNYMTKTVKLLENVDVHIVIWIRQSLQWTDVRQLLGRVIPVRWTRTYRKDICAYSETLKSESHELFQSFDAIKMRLMQREIGELEAAVVDPDTT